MKYCSKCGTEIPAGRAKTLPKTTTCASCSRTGRVHGHPMITGKTTYSELQIVDAETSERLTNLQDRRGYGISEGVRFDADKDSNENL